MNSLNGLIMELTKIREAVNSIEVKGNKNAAMVVYATERIDGIIHAINEVIENSESNQNGIEEGDTDGVVN